MKLPWFEKPNKLEPAPALTPEEMGALIRETAKDAAREAATQAVEGTARELMREMIAVSPMMGAPDPMHTGAPFKVYGWDNPLQWSTPNPPQRRPGSMVSINTLRQMADNYDVLRACINHLKREVSAVPIQIVAKESGDDRKSTKRLIKDTTAWFEEPGGLGGIGRRRSQFESEVIEDLCVVGAAALYFARTRGGNLLEVLPIDASTIRPRVDAYGFPGPKEFVWEQWIYGALVQQYTRDDIRYDGIYPRTYSPYFASPIEWLINAVNAGLRADEWNRRWLTDGNTPAMMLAIPGVTPAQAQEWTAYFDAMLGGNTQDRQKMKIVPSESTIVQGEHSKDQDFQLFELWLLRRTCAVMGVQPASIGFAGEQYKVSQEDSMESTSQFGAGVLLEWRQAMYNDVLSRMGLADRLTVENVQAVEEKAGERATRNATLVGAGIKTINEARQEEGEKPITGCDEPMMQNTMIPVSVAMQAKPDQGDTGDPNAKNNGGSGGNGSGGGKNGGSSKGSGSNASDGDAQSTDRVLSVRRRRNLSAGLAEAQRRQACGSETVLSSFDAVTASDVALLRAVIPDGPITIEEIARAVAAVQSGIYLCRHAQTDDSKAGLSRGWNDVPLNKQGRKDAKTVGKWLKGRDVAEMHRSDLRRAKETSRRIAKQLGAPIVATAEQWRDWTTGLLDIRSQDDVWPIIGDYVKNRPDADIPAGEAFHTFLGRVIPALRWRLSKLPETVGTQVIVTHSSVIRAAAAWIAAGASDDDTSINADVFLDTPIGDSQVLWIGPAARGNKLVTVLLNPLAGG